MQDQTLYALLLSSGVVAAVVTAVFSSFSARSAGQRVFELEQIKHQDSRETFRYTKLYEALTELRALPPIDYRYGSFDESGEFVESRERFKVIVEAATGRHSDVSGIYGGVQPLIVPALRAEVDDLMAREQSMSDQLARYALRGEPLPADTDVVSLIDLRRDVEQAVVDAVRNQIERLTATNQA